PAKCNYPFSVGFSPPELQSVAFLVLFEEVNLKFVQIDWRRTSWHSAPPAFPLVAGCYTNYNCTPTSKLRPIRLSLIASSFLDPLAISFASKPPPALPTLGA